MCNIKECLTDGMVITIYDRGTMEIKAGLINGHRFSALIVDKRSGDHLHFPYEDLRKLLDTAKRF